VRAGSVPDSTDSSNAASTLTSLTNRYWARLDLLPSQQQQTKQSVQSIDSNANEKRIDFIDCRLLVRVLTLVLYRGE
jgi:hypothetical protein